MLMSWPYSFIWQTTCELHSYGCWKYDIESFFLRKSFLWLVIFTHDIADFVCIFYIYNKSVILLIYLIKWNVKLFQFIIVKVFCLLRKWLFGLWKVTKISVPKCPLPIWKLIQNYCYLGYNVNYCVVFDFDNFDNYFFISYTIFIVILTEGV